MLNVLFEDIFFIIFLFLIRKEAAELRKEVNNYSLNQWMLEQELHSKTSKCVKLNEQCINLQAEIAKMKLTNPLDETSSKKKNHISFIICRRKI